MKTNPQICIQLSILAMLSIVDCLLHSRHHCGRSTQRFAGSSSPLHSSKTRDPCTVYLSIPDYCNCEEIGALISAFAEPPDVVLLDGDLGAGKTTFSRGFIRNKLGATNEAITSPTYLLSNTYYYKSIDDVKE